MFNLSELVALRNSKCAFNLSTAAPNLRYEIDHKLQLLGLMQIQFK
ncbi:hypothetical protein I3760_15G159900 [Carya illinoinensis]|nr:hypothetical protein I3760_15G159900 [Carya illinoinensis]